MAVKWLTTILALYLTGLSLWPCADEALSIIGQGNQGAFISAKTASSEASHDHQDHCTPFCSCACCAATITVASQFHYSPAYLVEVALVATTDFQYTLLQWADPLSAIWQPPKLVI